MPFEDQLVIMKKMMQILVWNNITNDNTTVMVILTAISYTTSPPIDKFYPHHNYDTLLPSHCCSLYSLEYGNHHLFSDSNDTLDEMDHTVLTVKVLEYRRCMTNCKHELRNNLLKVLLDGIYTVTYPMITITVVVVVMVVVTKGCVVLICPVITYHYPGDVDH